MKRALLIAATALALLIPVASLAQDSPKPAHSESHKTRTISAVINADGKSFLDTKQNRWTVANPAALAGLENQRVRVRYLVSTASHSVEILAVKALPTLAMLTAHPCDSAFRR